MVGEDALELQDIELAREGIITAPTHQRIEKAIGKKLTEEEAINYILRAKGGRIGKVAQKTAPNSHREALSQGKEGYDTPEIKGAQLTLF